MITQMECQETELAAEVPVIPPFVSHLTKFVRWSNPFLVPWYIYSMCEELPHAEYYALRAIVSLICLLFQGLIVGLNKQAEKGEVPGEKKIHVIGVLVILWVMTPFFCLVSILVGNFVIGVVFILNSIALTAVYVWIIQRPLRQYSSSTGWSDMELIVYFLFGIVLFAFGTFKAYHLLKLEALKKLQNSTLSQ